MLWLLWFMTQRNTVGMIEVSGDIFDPILRLNKTRTILVLARLRMGSEMISRSVVSFLHYYSSSQSKRATTSFLIVAQALVT